MDVIVEVFKCRNSLIMWMGEEYLKYNLRIEITINSKNKGFSERNDSTVAENTTKSKYEKYNKSFSNK